MPSQTVAPPPSFHQSPDQVSAAFLSAGFSKGLDGTLGAGDAYDDFAFGDARRHGDGVIFLRVRDTRFPNGLAGFGVERDEATVDDGRDDQALIERDATLHDAAADLGAGLILVDLGVPTPLFLAGARIDGEDDAPVGDAEESPVPEQGRSFLAATAAADIIRPDGVELGDVGGVDL